MSLGDLPLGCSCFCNELQQLMRKRLPATQLLPRFNKYRAVHMLIRCKGYIRFATMKGKELLLQVNSVHVNPVDSNLMVTSSNDWTVRLNDVRMLSAAPPDSKGVYCECCLKYIDLLLICFVCVFKKKKKQTTYICCCCSWHHLF